MFEGRRRDHDWECPFLGHPKDHHSLYAWDNSTRMDTGRAGQEKLAINDMEISCDSKVSMNPETSSDDDCTCTVLGLEAFVEAVGRISEGLV